MKKIEEKIKLLEMLNVVMNFIDNEIDYRYATLPEEDIDIDELPFPEVVYTGSDATTEEIAALKKLKMYLEDLI